jgi:hypothetical protein
MDRLLELLLAMTLHGVTAPSENPLDDLAFGGQQVDMAYVRKWASSCWTDRAL